MGVVMGVVMGMVMVVKVLYVDRMNAQNGDEGRE